MEFACLRPGSLVADYKIRGKLGEGGFGTVYKVTKGNQQYAMKVEGVAEKTKLLKLEIRVLQALAKTEVKHCCRIVDRGRNDEINYVVMTMVGRSLYELKKKLGDRFSMSTALRVGIQCLAGLRELHDIGYLHRDVKPPNFAIGVGPEHRTVYLLDFGMCRQYLDKNGQIRRPRDYVGFRGTTRYASLGCHFGLEMSRVDDLEAWFYQQTELTAGALPWRHVTDKERVKEHKVQAHTKKEAAEHLLKDCPPQYLNILHYIDRLRYYSTPAYEHIIHLLNQALNNCGANRSEPYDWER